MNTPSGNLLVLAELRDGQVASATCSAITVAEDICRRWNCRYSVLALGRILPETLTALCHLGADRVFVVEDVALDQSPAECWTPTVVEMIRRTGARLLLSPANARSRDVLPRAACRLDLGFASEVCALEWQGDELLLQRPMYAGQVQETVKLMTSVSIFTLRASEFAKAPPTASESPVEYVSAIAPDPAAGRIELLGIDRSESARPDPVDARVVCAGGRALKTKADFALIEELADVFGGAVAGTRAAVDLELVSSDLQVGQTGKIVAPDLYIACGISGALQHLAGMKSSKVIVAINKDPDAPIFQHATYGIVGDLFTIIPQLIRALK